MVNWPSILIPVMAEVAFATSVGLDGSDGELLAVGSGAALLTTHHSELFTQVSIEDNQAVDMDDSDLTRTDSTQWRSERSADELSQYVSDANTADVSNDTSGTNPVTETYTSFLTSSGNTTATGSTCVNAEADRTNNAQSTPKDNIPEYPISEVSPITSPATSDGDEAVTASGSEGVLTASGSEGVLTASGSEGILTASCSEETVDETVEGTVDETNRSRQGSVTGSSEWDSMIGEYATKHIRRPSVDFEFGNKRTCYRSNYTAGVPPSLSATDLAQETESSQNLDGTLSDECKEDFESYHRLRYARPHHRDVFGPDGPIGYGTEQSIADMLPPRRHRGKKDKVKDFFTLCWDTQQCKIFIGFPFGGLLGFGLYHLVVVPMALPETTRQFLGGVLVVGLALGFAISSAVRCVSCLMLPTFFGKAGRSYISTFAIAFLMAGPIENMVNNAQDITRSLTCAAELTANHTMAKWKFRLQPVGSVMKDMKAEGFLLKKIGKRVNKAFVPVKEEIRGKVGGHGEKKKKKPEPKTKKKAPTVSPSESAKNLEAKYKKRINNQCEGIFNYAKDKCWNMFNDVVNKCRDKVPWPFGFLCKIADFSFLCHIINGLTFLTGECDSKDLMNPGFGKMFQSSESSINTMEHSFDVEMQYKVEQTKEKIDYSTVENMRADTMHEFKRGRKVVEFCMLIIKRMLGFTFLLVVFSAYKYYKRYVTDLKFDNIYLTRYFRKIDARRKQEERKVLLPLKKVEAGVYIFPSTLKMVKAERGKLGKGTFLLITRGLLTSLIFFADHILYSALDIIRTHSRVDYKQEGINQIEIKVGGVGVMSQIVRMFIKGLNNKHELNLVTSNFVCLPKPVLMDQKYIYYVFGIYLSVWILVFLDSYCLRLRKLVASVFYRKREKQRILFLYNTMMRKRKHFLQSMIRRVKRKAKKLKLSRFPKLCCILALCKSSRASCLICGESEKKDYHRCDTSTCIAVYCPECFHDIKGKCYACLPTEEFSSTDSGDSIPSDDEDEV